MYAINARYVLSLYKNNNFHNGGNSLILVVAERFSNLDYHGNKNQWVLLIRKSFLAYVFLLALCYGAAAAAATVTPDDPALEFTLSALDGQQVRMSWNEKLTVLTFGALWCPNCRNELPELDAFAAANSARLTFYMVDIREPAEKVKRYLNEEAAERPDAAG